MTKAEKAVALAKDVLKQIKYYRNGLGVGGYLYFNAEFLDSIGTNDQLQKHIKTARSNCTLCALGACLLSYAKLYNEVTITELHFSAFYAEEARRKVIVDKLLNVFDEETIELIEMAFEGFSTPCYTQSNATNAFNRAYRTDDKLLSEIMKNIINNNGRFRPKKDKRVISLLKSEGEKAGHSL